jgi:integrase
MKLKFFNRTGTLYLRTTAPIRTLSTGVKIGNASVKRNVVTGSDYSVHEANTLIKKLNDCANFDDVQTAIRGGNTSFLSELWSEVATSSLDIQARQLWLSILGEKSDIELSVLNRVGNTPVFNTEVRQKITFFKNVLTDDYKTSTVSAYLSSLKRVLKVVEETYGCRMPLSACKSKAADNEPIILPYNKIEDIINAAKFGNPYPVLMALQIEGCMRWDDLYKINKDSFDEQGDMRYIVTIGKNSQLCRRMIRIDLWEQVRDLFQSGKLPNKDYDKYCQEIKKFVGTQKINVKVEIGYGRYVHRKEPLCDVVSSHVLRKTGINLWRSRGLDDATIRSRLSYHKSSQVYEKHYLNTTDEILIDKISKLAI